MNVLLLNIDSKIPNLALMKISAFYKQNGDDVSINNTYCPDIVYASVVFSKNKHLCDGLKFYYPNAKIFVGGYGFNDKQLPHEIEHIMPDYSIFNCGFSMGYTTRGCSRSCSFCIVPKMEGNIKKHSHPSEFWNQDHDTIMFLDNNWLALPKWFNETSKWVLDQDLTLMEHGMDIRLVTERNIDRIRELRIKPYYKFAYDSSGMSNIIIEKLGLLKEHGFNLKQEVSFYVYLDSDREFDNALHRCKLLKDHGTNAYIMFNITQKRTHRVKLLQRWANRRWHYWACDFEEYVDSYKKYKE
jgi:hypothetical protein